MEPEDELIVQLDALEAALAGAQDMTGAFTAELARMKEQMVFTQREVNSLSAGIGGGLRRAFDGVVFDGLRLSDALKTVARSIVDTLYSVSVRPVQGALGSLFLAFAVFTSSPFTRLDPAPFQGASLNPLLQDPALAVHPPLLYA
ncbi:MAG: hypothetical protein IE927_15645, partial [Rhodobacterales bacterium]|nr:hypothetical protein [Rhodobacterales bacterium]